MSFWTAALRASHRRDYLSGEKPTEAAGRAVVVYRGPGRVRRGGFVPQPPPPPSSSLERRYKKLSSSASPGRHTETGEQTGVMRSRPDSRRLDRRGAFTARVASTLTDDKCGE